jgi:hypothetical protein
MKQMSSEQYVSFRLLRTLFLTCVLLFAMLTVAAPAIQLFRFYTMPYRDLWWHISAADEFSRTQEFGRDPFYERAPPFTNFGLIDLINGGVALTLGCQARSVCAVTFLLGEAIFLLIAFWIGWSVGGSSVTGGLSVVACWIFSKMIFPYDLGLILVYLLYVSMWGPSNASGKLALRRWRDAGLWGAIWRGTCLGLSFAIHPFAGAFGALVIAITVSIDYYSRFREGAKERNSLKIILLLLAAFIVAAPWILFQVRLRPFLGILNEHNLIPAVETWANKGRYLPLFYWFALYAFLIGVAPGIRRSLQWRSYMCLGTVLLVTYTPWIFHRLVALTSIYFPPRLPLFFPYGVVAAMMPLAVISMLTSRKRFPLATVSVVACTFLMVAYGYRKVRVESYRFFQSEAGTPYDYLARDLKGNWHGRYVLSDPVTSYFARGMLGCYVIVVPAGDASAAAPHRVRTQIALDALRNGPSVLDRAGLTLDTVLLDKKRTYLPEYFSEYPNFRGFMALDYGQVQIVWGQQGWHKTMETANFILLARDK